MIRGVAEWGGVAFLHHPMTDVAAAKREERKRRILEKGSSRLSRITNTGRGKDYEGLDTSSVTPPRMPTSDSKEAPAIVSNATATATRSKDITESSQVQGETENDQFTSMLAAVQARMGNEAPGGTMPKDPLALMQQVMGRGLQTDAVAGAAHAAGASRVSPAQTTEVAHMHRSVQRIRLVQATLVFVFAFYIVFSSIFSHSHNTGLTGRSIPTDSMDKFSRDSFMRQWASLAWEYTPITAWLSKDDPSVFPWGALRTPLDWLRPYLGMAGESQWFDAELPAWPIFWVFVSMELGLQGVRIAMLQRAPVSLPGTLDSVVSMYAPGVRSLLTPLLTMGSLASSLVDDLCILLFAIGLGVLFCHVWTRS